MEELSSVIHSFQAIQGGWHFTHQCHLLSTEIDVEGHLWRSQSEPEWTLMTLSIGRVASSKSPMPTWPPRRQKACGPALVCLRRKLERINVDSEGACTTGRYYLSVKSLLAAGPLNRLSIIFLSNIGYSQKFSTKLFLGSSQAWLFATPSWFSLIELVG